MPQRARQPWFTDVQAIKDSLRLPDMVVGPRSEAMNVKMEFRSLVGAPDEYALIEGISSNFRATDDGYWHVHVDLAENKKRHGDAAGFAMGRVSGMAEETSRDPAMKRYVRIVRSYEIPLVAQIVAPMGDQIYFSAIVRFILQLKQLRGFNITSFSMDGFQSADSSQQLMLAGLVTAGMHVDQHTGEITGLPKKFSVDGTSGQPYRELLEATNERRVGLPMYDLLKRELRELETVGPGYAPDHAMGACFTGETRIPLLDGTTPRIEDLAGREVWVYSATPAGDLVPGRARGRLTRHTTEVVDVTLDDGRPVRCTPEHLWMLRNGTYKEAQALRPGVDRLMPCKRMWPANGGYERYTTPSAQKRLTHRLVCEAAHGPIPEGWLVHHRNGVKTDNRPENLVALEAGRHAGTHSAQRHEADPSWRDRMAAGTRRFNAERDYSQRRSGHWPRRTDVTIDTLPDTATLAEASRTLECDSKVIRRVLAEHGYASWSEWRAPRGANHRVRRVDRVVLETSVPVYDLEVDTWSNFALDAGVYVHNSKDVADCCAGVVGYLAAFGHAELVLPGYETVDRADLEEPYALAASDTFSIGEGDGLSFGVEDSGTTSFGID